jgi:hypothetical protein
MWYTLVRFKDSPKDVTGVSQTKTAAEALALLDKWETAYPEDTSVVFDPQNRPIQRAELEQLAQQGAAGQTS